MSKKSKSDLKESIVTEEWFNGICWLCGKEGAGTIIEVACETPNGKPCKPKEVCVHFGCYMDMPSE